MLTKKKKMAAIAATGMLSIGLLVGGASYALFKSEATNTNIATGGTLTLSSHRNDVPVEGPMFYVNDSTAGGRMGTGVWAPLDSHSRAMYIKNTGTLDGKLTKLFAEVESGVDAEKFAEQALVTVAVFETGGAVLDATALEQLNRNVDTQFKNLMQGGPLSRIAGVTLQETTSIVREAFLNETYNVDVNGQSVTVGISDLYVGSLKDMLNPNGVSAFPQVQLPSGGTMHLGYTVTLMNDNGKPFENNDIQNVRAQFKFKTLFEQVRNN
jgi:spore coat-associated protein N